MRRANSPQKQLLRYYSCGSDEKQLKGELILQLPYSIEYCQITNFKKEGKGIIQYFDESGQEIYVLFANWRNNKLNGKAALFNTIEDYMDSILLFSDGILVDEYPFDYSSNTRGIVDNDNGYRWEGGICNGKANGRGCEYDEENCKVFSGWYFENTRTGKGESYHKQYSSNVILQSRGNWQNGKEFGPISFYDKKGEYICDKIMINGEIETYQCIVDNPSILQFSNIIRKLTIQRFEGKDVNCVDFSACCYLEEIEIGDYCFLHTTQFLLQHHSTIHTLHIGRYSFCHLLLTEDGSYQVISPLLDKKRILNSRCSCIIEDCSHLSYIEISENSFIDYTTCLLTNLPSLENCILGISSNESQQTSLNFFWCKSFCMKDCPLLSSLIIGNFAFYYTYQCTIANCLSLSTIHIGYGGFSNSDGKNCTLLLENLPCLSQLILENEAFFKCTMLIMKKVGLMNENQVKIGPESLLLLKTIRTTDIHPSIIKTFQNIRTRNKNRRHEII